MKFLWLIGALSGGANAAIGTGPYWPGFNKLQYMFVFGDSYSTVSWGPSTAPTPTSSNPIGVQWPGVTSVGASQPNWVGYMTNGFNASSLLAFDYAVSGHNVTGFTTQVQTEFVPIAGRKPADAPWTADNSIFVSWIGINDVAENAPTEATISQIIQQNQDLYALGARNFVFINVPPWDRSPMGSSPGFASTNLGERILSWNAQLATSALAFSVQNADASTLVWSSWDTFTSILNNPSAFNLTSPTAIGGDVWKDDLHPTSFIHYRIANDLAGWLSSLPAGASSTTTSASLSSTGGAQLVTVTPGASQTTGSVSPIVLTTPGSTATVIPQASNTPAQTSGTPGWILEWTLLFIMAASIVIVM